MKFSPRIAQILSRLHGTAVCVPFQRQPVHLRETSSMTSVYGPTRPGTRGHGIGPNRILYAAVETPRASEPRRRFVHRLRDAELEHLARGTTHLVTARAVPVSNVRALCAARSTAHVEGGLTASTRERENGITLCRAALEEADACLAAFHRARTWESRMSLADHARIALEAARLVAEDFELGVEVVVPAFSVLAPYAWDFVACFYAREAALLDRPADLPEDDALALEGLRL
ncbi:hypothetical protein [Methylobacterium planeticum]|uniref:Uncharacterized protein n=1 Tax=Methylobacterium planeticum TaxID=2615211 RepID=A0A6N6MMQ2_9HYPH|nr:hypothetical protein [Methylobacterium planeticum]KAB1071151.1 hypothetical protein F6X51_19825 [Methylobacterium planeticum]